MRFVILYHEFPPCNSRRSHWDLMLESKTVEGLIVGLKTWALDIFPLERFSIMGSADGIGEESSPESAQPNSQIELEIPARRLVDHRLDYLDFEGAVSDDRGKVYQLAAGTYSIVDESKTTLSVDLTVATINKFEVPNFKADEISVRIPLVELGQRSSLVFSGMERRA